MTTFNDTYEIRSEIGRGGMSVVYLAEHKRLHTSWAVKAVAKAQGSFDFLAEANILKRLQHPMLPRIVDIFEDETNIYIVEDFVEGITLSDVLKQHGRVDEATGLRWFKELCSALRYLHEQKPNPIIYRDMKPSNIMLQPDGSLKLIDFGIAREYKETSGGDTTYIGTKGYAAPEQFGSAQTDARTDIYALGVTMYHLLTGKSPYEPPYNFVPARQLVSTLSHGTEHILDKCIQNEPHDRYQSVAQLLDDLEHIYKYDKAYKKYRAAKRARVAVIVVMLLASFGLMAAGRSMISAEREEEYSEWLAQAASHMEAYQDDYEATAAVLGKAKEIFPDRIDADRLQTYALYLAGRWQECADYGAYVQEKFGIDSQTRLFMASAQFELGDYEAAAIGFAQGGSLGVENLRDYAVCLGRLGRTDEAEAVLSELTKRGAVEEETLYVQGEVLLARDEYEQAEASFLAALEKSDSAAMTRRCYLSLGEVYRECAALFRLGESPIATPATKSARILSEAVVKDALRYDTALWEMLAMAYFEAYHTDESVPEDYITKAAECFNRVIELGMTKDYLYSNLYAIYYEMKDYDAAAKALDDYEAMFPADHMPHALRGMLLITVENAKSADARDYSAALAEYELAGEKLGSSDESMYYQQLGSLIENLRSGGWL